MPELTIIQQIAVWILPVLLAITLHEAAHGWVANRLGDDTARQLGRLSFNPLKHVDLFGTVIMPLLVLVLSNFSFVFGWAKPVPINASRFSNPRRDLALATAAGPLSNLIMAILWVACIKAGVFLGPQTSMTAIFMILTGKAGVIINLLLAWLNLLPIPPLDGSRIVAAILPARQAIQYEKIEPFGFMIILLLMFTGALSLILSPLIEWSYALLLTLFNL